MKLSAMRYKDYVWPHNPKVYSISYERKIAAYKIPFGTYTMQDMGLTYRVLRGEGEFVGEGAYEEFKCLASLFYQGGAGILVHPVWQSSNAHFVSLSLKQEPREDYVSYTFEFWEDHGVAPAGLTKISGTAASAETGGGHIAETYTVVSGDTLWGIANRYGLSMTELIDMNPQISNPNLIHPGDSIRVA